MFLVAKFFKFKIRKFFLDRLHNAGELLQFIREIDSELAFEMICGKISFQFYYVTFQW